MAQFGATGKNPPWVRTAGLGQVGQPTQLTSPLLVQATIGGPGVTSAQAANPVSLQQTQQQQAVAQQATAYNTAGLTALSLAQVGMDQSRENVYLVQNAALQAGTVISQPGVALPTSLAANAVGTPGLALPTTLATTPVATVSYPAPRVLQHATQFQPQAQQPQPQQHAPKQRVFTGTVSKLHENFGFVDDDVFFQTTCVKGTMPKVGDRVLVEASYNPNMPFKWNAARIQVLPNQAFSQSQVQMQTQQQPPQTTQQLVRAGLMGTNPAPSIAQAMAPAGVPPQLALSLAAQQGSALAPAMTLPPQLTQQAPAYNQVPPPASLHAMPPGPPPVNRLPPLMATRRHSPPPMRRDRDIRREERRERERHREREHERERERIIVPRKRSRSPRPRSRSPPRRRLRVIPRYVVQVPKISLDTKEANVMEVRRRYGNMYVPSDFFYSSFVWMDAFPLSRPFTLDRSCSFHIMNKEVEPIVDNDAVLEPPDADHSFTAKVMLLAAPPLEEIFHKSCALAEDSSDAKENFVHCTRLISFLVGLKSKNETMAIGGPWSPSLDGPNPDKDPSVLIKTAIRTCKALTGIDLTPCTKWYRFAEVAYHRGETTHKGRVAPARVETVVLFLPDVWSCTPTRKEWHNMTASYKKQLQKKLHEETPEANENQQSTEDTPKDALKKDPSHHSDLDPKTMKINDLRHELEVRSLSYKGLKSQLIARLTKALKAEHDKEEEEMEGRPEDEEVDEEEKTETDEKDDDKKKKEEEDRKKEEKEKAVRERRYTLPEVPSIIVHPSRTAKGGKFDCTVMSLSVLLDYRQEDNKEYSFEVSLFAELFNEMLMRDFSFRIYRSIVDIPEKKEAEDKEKEKEKRKDKEKKDDRKDEKDDNDSKRDASSKKEEKRKKEEEEKDSTAGGGDDENEEDEEEEEDMEEEEDDERKDKKKDDKKKERDKKQDKIKLYTSDPGLLLAFVYFDQNHCGYLLDKDLEEILYALGLHLSRAQVRKLLQNAVTKDKLMYRKLIDKPKPRDEQEKRSADDKTEKELSTSKTDKSVTNIEELSLGNKIYLTSGKCASDSSDVTGDRKPPDVSGTGHVMYNGALLDITKLLQQLERSEKARTDTEQKLKSIYDELTEVKDVANAKEQLCQKLCEDLKDYKKRYRNSEDELKQQQDKAQEYIAVIRSCHSLIRPVMTADEVSGGAAVRSRVAEESEDSAQSEQTPDAALTTFIKKEILENGDA